MSNVYSLEPRTRGRVILHTTQGPVELFLYSDEAPVAARNFVQHALNGYYDGLPFHRVLPGELAQTGDPSGSGSGGVAAIGDPDGYPREQHGRLKFRRRGIAAMVADEEGKARSQFFLTLAPTPWLDGQHTIFGQVQGDSIFNLLELSARKVDAFEGDNLPKVKSMEVTENPFPDLKTAPRSKPTKEPAKSLTRVVPTAKKAVKSNTLLSFQDELDSDSDDQLYPQVRAPARRRQKVVRPQAVQERKLSSTISKQSVGPSDQVGAGGQVGKNEKATSKTPLYPDAAGKKRQVEEEFERIKAQLITDSKAKAPTEGERGAEEIASNGNNTPGQPDAINVTGRKRRRRQDESDIFQHLKAFENRLTKTRREANGSATADTAQGMAACFSRRLRLATVAAEQEEYEVRYGPPPRKRAEDRQR